MMSQGDRFEKMGDTQPGERWQTVMIPSSPGERLSGIFMATSPVFSTVPGACSSHDKTGDFI